MHYTTKLTANCVLQFTCMHIINCNKQLWSKDASCYIAVSSSITIIRLQTIFNKQGLHNTNTVSPNYFTNTL